MANWKYDPISKKANNFHKNHISKNKTKSKTKTSIKLRSEGKRAKAMPYGGVIPGLMDLSVHTEKSHKCITSIKSKGGGYI